MFLQLVSLLLATVLTCYGAVDIEKYLKVCARNSPDVNDCLVDAVQEGLIVMADGIKELGVPPCDPYIQKELRLEYKNNQVQVKMMTKNIRVEGLKMSTVRDARQTSPLLAFLIGGQKLHTTASYARASDRLHHRGLKALALVIYYLEFLANPDRTINAFLLNNDRLRADEDNFHLEIDMYTPAVFISANYDGSGSYNALNITAHGTVATNMSDLTYTWKLDGKPEVIDGEVYVRIKSLYMRPDVSSMRVRLINDSPDSKELTELGARLVNENWRILYKELLPFAMDNWNKIGTKIANKIFLQIPYNRLFPNKEI